ncbi:hypothetical protein BHO_0900100 (plasmid) [Borrelia hermsii YBT]|uniref:Uncharacterized protein n=1 Tax=Borrelia hermsii YBT TaxID=1313295 RepID=W5T2M2_BORHE|nr:hypothetical protein BHO_0900100 [Borrelia hermsii YBT]
MTFIGKAINLIMKEMGILCCNSYKEPKRLWGVLDKCSEFFRAVIKVLFILLFSIFEWYLLVREHRFRDFFCNFIGNIILSFFKIYFCNL